MEHDAAEKVFPMLLNGAIEASEYFKSSQNEIGDLQKKLQATEEELRKEKGYSWNEDVKKHENDALKAKEDLDSARRELVDLTRLLEKERKTVEQLSKENEKLPIRHGDTSSTNDAAFKTNEDLVFANQDLTKTLRKERVKFGELSQEHELLIKRFSELSCNKMVSGNANVVELSQKRPEKLAERFSNVLYNGLFYDACFSLTEEPSRITDDEAADYLSRLLKDVFFTCRRLLSSQKTEIWYYLKQIRRHLLYPGQPWSTDLVDDPMLPKNIPLPSYVQLNGSLHERLATTITEDWMNPSEDSLEHLYKTVLEKLRVRHNLKSQGAKVTSYLKESVQLVWLLLTRDPPLHLEFCPKPSQNECTLFNFSDQTTASSGSYHLKVIWPALCQQDGKVVMLGEAQRILTGSYKYSDLGTEIF